jgi:hypothetical protein
MDEDEKVSEDTMPSAEDPSQYGDDAGGAGPFDANYTDEQGEAVHVNPTGGVVPPDANFTNEQGEAVHVNPPDVEPFPPNVYHGAPDLPLESEGIGPLEYVLGGAELALGHSIGEVAAGIIANKAIDYVTENLTEDEDVGSEELPSAPDPLDAGFDDGGDAGLDF